MFNFNCGKLFSIQNNQYVELNTLAGRYVWEKLRNKKGNYRWRQCKIAQSIYQHPKIDVVNLDFKLEVNHA